MRPRWQFVLIGLLFAAGAAIALSTVLYLAGFIVFSLHETGAWSAPLFGSRGWITLFRSLPWALIALSLAFILILETLVRRYAFAYRMPLVYSLLAIVGVAMAAGPLTAPLHRAPFQAARRGDLPFGGSFYRRYGAERLREVRHGEIESFAPGGFVLLDAGNATSLILIVPDARPDAYGLLKIGDTVSAFGADDGAAFRARGVRPTGF